MDDLNLPKQRVIKTNAGIWKRTLAFFIDFIIIRIIILNPFANAISQKLPIPEDLGTYFQFLQSNQELVQSFAPMMFAMSALTLAYFVLFEYKMFQTPGMMLMKLKVEPEKHIKLNLWRVILRNLFAFPIGPLFLLWIIEPIYVIVAKRRMTEIFSKTNTVMEVVI